MATSGPPPTRAGLIPIIALSVVFVLISPVGLLTLPLAVILWIGGGRSAPWLTSALAGGITLWWLVQRGDPPQQVVRTAAVVGTATFAVLSRTTRMTVTHRSLVSVAAATGAVAGLMAMFGRSWEAVRWWVEYRAGFTAQTVLSGMWAAVPRGADGLPSAGEETLVVQLEELFDQAIPLFGELFPATVAIQLLVGLGLATVIADRLGVFAGRAPDRFVEFRFSEHIGWAAVLALATLLLGAQGALNMTAANVLAVGAAFYGTRGLAVAWYGIKRRGGPGALTVLVIVLAATLLLPAFIVWSIVIGVADAGLDLRRRWATPRNRN